MSRRIAILGAGPTGLDAALAASDLGFPFTVYEASDAVAASLRDWGHVRLFSPWRLDVSPRARRHLEAAGHSVPDSPEECPLAAELVELALAPLAHLPEIAPHLRTRTRVLSISRQGLLKSDEIGTGRRGERPFRILLRDASGYERVETADVVLDCTGTWNHPNPLGDGGIPAPGERALERSGHVVRRIPNVVSEADSWAGQEVLVVGGGHSAQTAVRDLAELAAKHPATRIRWAIRESVPPWSPDPEDPLPGRAALGRRALELANGASPSVSMLLGAVVETLAPAGDRVRVRLRRERARAAATESEIEVDRVLSLTGSVGDASLYRQLQVHECWATSGPMKLAAALLGSAGGDCLAQESHGAETLVNPEPDFFLLGSKSYGRNNTFLLRVGWQQVDEVFGLLARSAS